MTPTCVITIGKFDGVHRGHRAILATAKKYAQNHDARVVAMTFDPHPNATLDPANQPPRLCSTEQKVSRLKQAGADQVVVLKPIPEVLDQSPEAFLERLSHTCRPIAFVQGKDFRFGKNRTGDIPTLQALGKHYGFEVILQPSFDITLSDLTLVTVHSSVIRWLIGQGRMEDAHRCLALPFSITSTVIKGEQRGRTIGFPTVNLELDRLHDHMLPADGVYAGCASWPGSIRKHPAAISVGTKPSFGQAQLAIEAHLLDFDNDLYGQTVTLEFAHWVRDQARFPSVDALREQLTRDIEKVRRFEPLAVSY